MHSHCFSLADGLTQLAKPSPCTPLNLRKTLRLTLSTSHISGPGKQKKPSFVNCTGASPEEVRTRRKAFGVVPSYKRVDTCAAEFEVRQTPDSELGWFA